MRDDGYSTDAEGFNLQSLSQGLGTALPGMVQGASQGAAVGSSVMPGWGTLIGALGGAAMSLASQGSTPSASAPPRPAPQPAPAPMAAPAPAAFTPPPAAASPFAGASPLAGAAGGGAGNLTQVLSLLQNPQVQQLLGSFLAQRAGGGNAAAAKPAGSAEAEPEADGGAIGWLMSQRVARLG